MNFDAEKKKIQKMNRSELNKYEEQYKKMLVKAESDVKEAKKKESLSIRKAITYYGQPSQELKDLVLALSYESRMKKLNSDIQKRKNQLLTPQERVQREAKKKELLKQLEMMRAM